MKIRDILAIMAVALTAVGCNQQDEGLQQDERVPILLKATVEDATKGPTLTRTATTATTQDTEFINGRQVKVWIKENDVSHTDWIKNPIIYEVKNDYDDDADDGDLDPVTDTTPFFFPVGVNIISIFGVHPSTYTSNTDFTVAADQTSDADYAASDLCYSPATNHTRTTGPVDTNGRQIMTFQHALSKIVVEITTNTGKTLPATVKLLAKRTTKMTWSSGSDFSVQAEATGDASYITMGLNDDGTGTKVSGGAIIPPQTIAAGTSFISFTVADLGPMIYPLPANTTFTSGKRYTYNIKVNNVGITATTDIDDWGSTVNGEVVGEAFIRPTLPIEYVAEYNMGAPSAEPMTMASDHLKTSTYFYNEANSLSYFNKHITISGMSGTYHLPSIYEMRALAPLSDLSFTPASETIVQTGKGEQLQWGKNKLNDTYAVPLQTFYNEFATSPSYNTTSEKTCYAIRLKASDIAGPLGYGAYTCAYRYTFVESDPACGNGRSLHIKVRYLGPYSTVVLSDITNSSFWNESGAEYFERIFPAFGFVAANGNWDLKGNPVIYRTATLESHQTGYDNYFVLLVEDDDKITTISWANTQYGTAIRLFKDAE